VKRRFCIFAFHVIIWLFANNNLFAKQTGSISGIVYSGTYQNVLPSIIESLEGINKRTITDSTGHFKFTDVPMGAYTLVFTGLGYKKTEHKITIKSDEPVFFSANLEEDFSSISAVIVVPKTDGGSIKGYNIMSQVDLSLRPANSAQDLLRLVPGLFIAQHAGGGKAEQIFLRGFDCDHGTDFASYVDGIPVNMVSHAHGQGYADLHFVIPETVKEMDVYKGPYEARFGDLATSGAAEFKTFNVLDHNEIKLEYGQFNTYRALLMVNLLGTNSHIFSELQESLYLATEYRYTDSYFDNPQHFSRYNALLKYYGQLTDKTVMTFSASGFSSKWDASGQIPERAVAEGVISRFGSIDPSEGGQTDRVNINLQFDHNYDPDHRIRNQFYYSRYDFNLYSDFTFFLVDSVHGDEVNQVDHRNLFGYNGSYDLKSKIFGLDTKTTIGYGARYDNANVSLIHDQARVALDTFVNGKLNQLNAFSYLDENIFITPKFRINPGLRFDFFNFNFQNHTHPDSSGDVIKTRISPKLNFFYDLNNNVEFYIKSGYGFHSNDARAIIINRVDNINDNVLPRAFGSDMGTLFKPFSNVIINFNVWILSLENELVYNGDDGTVSSIGPTFRKGADLGIRYEFYKNFFLDADLNYSYGRRLNVPSDSIYIPLAPIITSTGGVSYKSKSGISAGVRYRYLGDRPANEAWSRTATGYFIWDGMISYKFKSWEVGLSIENIANLYWKEAQFDTETRLKGETSPVTQIDYTPGTPRSIKGHVAFYF